MNDYVLQLPGELMQAAQQIATENQVSLNQWFLSAIADKIQAEQTFRGLREYAEKTDEARLSEILSRVPDIEPLPGDEV